MSKLTWWFDKEVEEWANFFFFFFVNTILLGSENYLSEHKNDLFKQIVFKQIVLKRWHETQKQRFWPNIFVLS